MAGQHSRVGPSGFKAAKLCPGKPNAEEGLPDEVTVYAAEGTAFHEVAADCLLFDLEPENFLGAPLEADGFDFTFNDEMARHMRNGLALVRELSAGGQLFVETKVSLAGVFGDDDFGTSDVGIINLAERELTVFDWKYGGGVAVQAVDNDQGKLYGLGFWNSVAWKYFLNPEGVKVRIIIEQPRNSEGGGEWWTTMEELFAWAQTVARPAYLKTLEPDAPRIPGEVQCQFCKARRTCPERAAWHLEMAALKFDDLDAMDPEKKPKLLRPDAFTPEHRSLIARHKKSFEKWLEDVHAQVVADALGGRPTPNVKAVLGAKGHRYWTDEDKAEALLVGALGAKKAFTKKLISPAQAEELLGTPEWEKALSLIDQPDGKPVLVPLSDVRPALTPVAEKFEDLSHEDDAEALI